MRDGARADERVEVVVAGAAVIDARHGLVTEALGPGLCVVRADRRDRLDHPLPVQAAVVDHAAVRQARVAHDSSLVAGVERRRQHAAQPAAVVTQQERRVAEAVALVGQVPAGVEERAHGRPPHELVPLLGGARLEGRYGGHSRSVTATPKPVAPNPLPL